MAQKRCPSSSSSKGSVSSASASTQQTTVVSSPILENKVLSPRSSLVHFQSHNLYATWAAAMNGGLSSSPSGPGAGGAVVTNDPVPQSSIVPLEAALRNASMVGSQQLTALVTRSPSAMMNPNPVVAVNRSPDVVEMSGSRVSGSMLNPINKNPLHNPGATVLPHKQESGTPLAPPAPIKISYKDVVDEIKFWETSVICDVLGANPP